jgi:predicted nucleotide-binding protein
MDVSPTSGHFRMLTGASVAYGLTEGGGQAELISLTPLGRRIVSPTDEGDDLLAMREAVLKPRVVREFLEKYNGSPLPSESVALKVIETMGVPLNVAKRALEMILANAEALGLLVEIKGKRYVRLEPPTGAVASSAPAAEEQPQPSAPVAPASVAEDPGEEYDVDEAPAIAPHRPAQTDVSNNRVFITHGRNAKIVEQIQKILVFGKFEPVVSVNKQTVAKPVPDKVMDDMRTCGAAIVHVGLDQKLLDAEGNEHVIVNQNVLIEIGAAMALYGRRFILLVERGVGLPSNLQGLYEVRYEGDQLDHDATMKLLEAFNDFK